MNSLLVIVVATFAVVSGNPVAPCLSSTDIVSNCLSESGLNMSDYTSYQQPGTFDPEVIQEQCRQFPVYREVYNCISAEFNRCSITNIGIPSGDQLSQSMDLLCNDSNIRFECFGQIQQQNEELQSCIMSQYRNISPNTPMQQIACEMTKLSMKCVVDVVTKCDAHTASVVAEMTKVIVSSTCGETVAR